LKATTYPKTRDSSTIKVNQYYITCTSTLPFVNNKLETPHDILNQIIWNNEAIKVNNKSCYYPQYIEIGIQKVRDMMNSDGKFLRWNCLKGKGLKSNNYLDWFSLVDAIPIKWKQAELLGPNNEPCSPDSDQLKLVFDSREMKITQITSKMFYNILSTKLHEKPTAQERYNLIFSDIRINWKEIYALPFIVALDTRTREFQLKILHRILTTNVMLKKVWLSGISRVYFWQRRRGNSRTFILSLSLFHSFLVRSH